MDHDQAFKRLLSDFPLEFLRLFLPDMAEQVEPGSLVPLDKEVFTQLGEGARRTADLVMRAKVRDKTSFFLIHVEHEAQRRKAFARRMFQYFCLLHDRYNVPVYPIALLSYKGPRTLQPSSYRVAFAEFEALHFQFKVIQLNRLDWQDHRTRLDPIATALMSRMGMDSADKPMVKAASLKNLASIRSELTLKGAEIIAFFIDKYLRLDKQEEAIFQKELESMPPEDREAIMEFTTSWEKKGLKKGLRQGRQLGALHILEAVLKVRFGPLADSLHDSLARVDKEETLLALVPLAMSCESADEFQGKVRTVLEQPGL